MVRHGSTLWHGLVSHEVKVSKPICHSPVILPYILTIIWCMYIILSEYESVRPDVWRKNKCRSLWPIFHGPVIVPYTLKNISCMNIIIWDYESVWPDALPQSKCRSPWPIFHGPVILPYILKTVWCMYILLSEYESVRPDICFMVQWLCLLPWRLFHVGTSLFGLWISMTDAWPQNKCRSPWPIFHGPTILCYILKTIWRMNLILGDYGSVWPEICPLNKCMSVWPIFHGPLFFPNISKTIWWMIVIFFR